MAIIDRIPNSYTEGYARACLYDQALADKYILHTTIGDPVLDEALEEVAFLKPKELNRYVHAGIEQQSSVMRAAPQGLRDFFENLGTPSWLDYKAFDPGIRAFHANTNSVLVAFLTGVLIEGFSTLIAKAFYITGRVARTDRRLMQNNRQLLEIFMPGGLERDGDGFKLSLRVRIIHARIRMLLKQSDEWRPEDWGTPVSAAHLGYAIVVFSLRLLHYSKLLGATFNKEEEESVMSLWRYTGYVMGVPETILYTNQEEAARIYHITSLLEPETGEESVVMANTLIDSAPKLSGITDPTEAKELIEFAHRLSRALLGDRMGDQLGFKKGNTFGLLFTHRMKQRFMRARTRERQLRFNNFDQMLKISLYDNFGISYKMPDHVKQDKSSDW